MVRIVLLLGGVAVAAFGGWLAWQHRAALPSVSPLTDPEVGIFSGAVAALIVGLVLAVWAIAPKHVAGRRATTASAPRGRAGTPERRGEAAIETHAGAAADTTGDDNVREATTGSSALMTAGGIIADPTFQSELGSDGDWRTNDGANVVIDPAGGKDGGRALRMRRGAAQHACSTTEVYAGARGDRFRCRVRVKVSSDFEPTSGPGSWRLEIAESEQRLWPSFVLLSDIPTRDEWCTVEGEAVLAGVETKGFAIQFITTKGAAGTVWVDYLNVWKIASA